MGQCLLSPCVTHAIPPVQVEQAAVELEGDDSDSSATYVALKNLLLAKGVITPQVGMCRHPLRCSSLL